MLSNWTGHIKACTEKHRTKDEQGAEVNKTKPKQHPLLKYVSRSANNHESQSSTSSQGNHVPPSEDKPLKSQIEPEKVCCMLNDDISKSTADGSIEVKM